MNELSTLTSEKVREALAYTDAMRRTGLALGADVIDAAIEAVIADNITNYQNGRKDTLAVLKERTYGLTSLGSAGVQMQSAVVRQIEMLEAP